MTEMEKAFAQIDSLAGRLVRIIDVCELLATALTHPTSPEIHRRALDAYFKLQIDYPDPPPHPRTGP